ncbi:hypothetical protein DB459_25640 [Bradyrhizobium sp. WD16]|nr:hypothetical protein DB459_25640 [Bradyrhizobium sp. WD16]
MRKCVLQLPAQHEQLSFRRRSARSLQGTLVSAHPIPQPDHFTTLHRHGGAVDRWRAMMDRTGGRKVDDFTHDDFIHDPVSFTSPFPTFV